MSCMLGSVSPSLCYSALEVSLLANLMQFILLDKTARAGAKPLILDSGYQTPETYMSMSYLGHENGTLLWIISSIGKNSREEETPNAIRTVDNHSPLICLQKLIIQKDLP